MHVCVGWCVKWNSMTLYNVAAYNFIEWMISMIVTVRLWRHSNIVRIRPDLCIYGKILGNSDEVSCHSKILMKWWKNFSKVTKAKLIDNFWKCELLQVNFNSWLLTVRLFIKYFWFCVILVLLLLWNSMLQPPLNISTYLQRI